MKKNATWISFFQARLNKLKPCRWSMTNKMLLRTKKLLSRSKKSALRRCSLSLRIWKPTSSKMADKCLKKANPQFPSQQFVLAPLYFRVKTLQLCLWLIMLPHLPTLLTASELTSTLNVLFFTLLETKWHLQALMVSSNFGKTHSKITAWNNSKFRTDQFQHYLLTSIQVLWWLLQIPPIKSMWWKSSQN